MAAKAKGKEKEKQAPQASLEPPQEKEVVPGKLTEKDWIHLLGQEEGPVIAAELVNEVVEVAFSIVYTHYLEKQSFPYTVQQARRSLLQIIEWQFLSPDEGEGNTTVDPSWTEDDEPTPAVIDSWARGIVPQASLECLETEVEVVEPAAIQTVVEAPPTTREIRHVTTASTLDSSMGRAATSTLVTSASTRPSPVRRKDRVTRPRPVARRPNARLLTLSHPPPLIQESPDGQPNSDKTESPQPPVSCTPTSSLGTGSNLSRPLPFGMKPAQLSWQKEVTYDESGKIVNMVKLDATKFPSHCVRPRVRVLQPLEEPPKHGGRKRTVKSTPTTVQYPSKKPIIDEMGLLRGRRDVQRKVTVTEKKSGGGDPGAKESTRFPEVPTLPSLVDTIDPLPGVTVREAGRTIRGARSLRPSGLVSPRSNMHQVHPLDEMRAFSTEHDFVVTTPAKLNTSVTHGVGSKHVHVTS